MKQETPVKTVCRREAARDKDASRAVWSWTASRSRIPDRVISETGHVTKGELAEYHAAVAPYMLPQIIMRHPLSLLRCPSGIGNQCFYQRNPGKGLGADIKPFEFRHKGKKYEYLYIEDEKGLLEIIQMGAIEIHPWGASVDDIDHPDRMIFDLDPAPDVPFEAVKLAAQDLRQRLQAQRAGVHAEMHRRQGTARHRAARRQRTTGPVVKTFAAALAHEMVAATPAGLCRHDEQGEAQRARSSSITSATTTRPRRSPIMRSARGPARRSPCRLAWKELDDLESGSQFTMKDVLARLKAQSSALPAPPAAQRLPL